jgi:hypothetical protein
VKQFWRYSATYKNGKILAFSPAGLREILFKKATEKSWQYEADTKKERAAGKADSKKERATGNMKLTARKREQLAI